MKVYRVNCAISFDIEAENAEQAELEALKLAGSDSSVIDIMRLQSDEQHCCRQLDLFDNKPGPKACACFHR